MFKKGSGVGGTNLSATSVDNIVFTHGRRGPTGNLPPNTLTVTLVRKSPTPAPNSWSIGETVSLEATTPGLGGGTIVFFRGQVTDLTFDRDIMTVTAVSEKLASLGRVLIDAPLIAAGTSTYNAVDTLCDLATAAGWLWSTPTFPVTSVLTHNVPAATQTNALSAVNTVVNSEWNGLMVEWLTSLEVQSQEWRRLSTMGTNRKFDYSSTGTIISRDWKFAKRVGDKVNRCTATAPVPSASSLSFTYSETADITTNGTFAVSKSTTLDDINELEDFARAEVKHLDDVRYSGVELRFDTTLLTDVQRNVFWSNFYCGAYLKTPTIDSALPVEWFVEGLRLTITRTDCFVDAFVSDLRLTVAGQRWSDVTSGVKWNTVLNTLTWDDVLFTAI